MAEYVTLKKPDGTVIYPQSVIAQVADGSVASSQLDWSTMPFELVYDATIAANSSSSATIDVPIDLVTYRKLTIDFTYEAGNGPSSWATSKALDGSKNILSTNQTGREVEGSSFANINRNGDQIIAGGNGIDTITHLSIELARARVDNYPAFIADGYGMTGNSTANVKSQKFSGRVQAQAQNVKYIRFTVPYAKVGGHVIVYGIR